MTRNPQQKHVRLSVGKRIGLIVAGLFLFYVAAGFWVVPPLIKSRLENQLTEVLGRKVTVGALKLNPLVLSATTSELTVHETDGAPFAGFETLYLNVQLSSIFRWAGMVKEIRLSSPYAMLRLMPGGKMNIDDLITRFSHPAQPSDPDHGLPRANVARLEVSNGKFAVENRIVSEPVQDVISPITFTVENLSTLQGREGEFWFNGTAPFGGTFALQGRVTLNPLTVKGNFTTGEMQLSHYWEHVRDLVSFQVANGVVGTAGAYTVTIDENGLGARLENAAVRMDNFELVEKGKKKVLIDLPVLTTAGIHADLKTHEIGVESVQTANARIESWLSADGRFALQTLLLSDLDKLMKKKAAQTPAHGATPTQPWQVTLEKLEATGWKLVFEDRTLIRPGKLSVDDIHAVARNLSNKKGAQATIGLAMRINQTGAVNVDGKAGLDPLQADMKIRTAKIALKPFQPYVDDAVNAQITGGSTSSAGRFRYRGKNTDPQITYAGDFSVDQVKLRDRIQTKDFITLARIKADGIVLNLLPNQLGISDVLIDRPHARVTVDEAGVINVVNAFAPKDKKEHAGEDNLLQRVVNFLIMQFKGPMPMRVDRIRLDRFTADLMDESVSPAFKTQMEITDGEVNGLSSEPEARADFKLRGSIDGTAAIEASGEMNPMSALKYSNVSAALRDFSLPSVSSYSGKYIGFKIAEGTLQTDMTYKVTDDSVDGRNDIIIDRLELGEKVASPDAINLPVQLGIALLKDRNGRIALQVPVVGNARNPEFDFAKTIQSAITGTIEEAGNAPFAALGEVGGFTGEQLRTVAFDFGFSALQESEAKKLDVLATVLNRKTGLVLGIAGTADRQMDMAAIMGESPATPPDKKESDAGKQSPLEADARGVSDADNRRLEKLAKSRTDTVRAYLIEQARIDAARIQIEPSRIKPAPDGEYGLVKFSLSIEK